MTNNQIDTVSNQAVLALLVSLRLAPILSFAPPFSLLRLPGLIRALLTISVAYMIISGQPLAFSISDGSLLTLAGVAIHELAIGLAMALPLHLLFGGIYFAGRAVDIQAGFGLALLIDPSTRTQVPLIGTLLAYITGAVFFFSNGHGEVLRILAASVKFAPPDSPLLNDASYLAIVGAQFVTMSSLALGLVGGLLLAMLACDVVVALLSRTVPQMNALMLGIQVKAIVMLTILPLVVGFAAGPIARMIAITLETMPALV